MTRFADKARPQRPRRSLRGWRAAVVVAGMALLMVSVPVAQTATSRAMATPISAAALQPEPKRTFDLTIGEPVFWHSDDGLRRTTLAANTALGLSRNFVPPETGTGGVETCAESDDPVNPCWSYYLDVPEGAGRLSVAIDMNRRGDCWQLELWKPNTYNLGSSPAHFISLCPELIGGLQLWNGPIEVPAPEPGAWVVRVVPFFVDDWGFRLRALASDVPARTGERILPNLEAHPPYEFGFQAPANPAAGTAVDKHNQLSDPLRTCTEDEQEEAREAGKTLTRCLRFSAGMYNTGRGDLELLLLEGGTVMQRIRLDDAHGTVHKDVPAGEWEFHDAHNHPHYLGFVSYELYRVQTSAARQPAGRNRIFVGTGNKAGWNPADQRYADWTRFDQGPSFLSDSSSAKRCFHEGAAASSPWQCITQENGWGDHYRWQRPGNFVDIGAEEDGDFVVRMVADGEGRVAESDEHDNSAYAWIRIVGDVVTICERGYGDGPWDRRKQLLPDNFWDITPTGASVGTTADAPSAKC